ncbi:S-layer homology domain-containing protein [Paenibacillus sp. LHD-38]|uniref:S-layer homology domain-containing protein n=1 Tax=Paenibacillus sp. LHD-38 TaxID=3072143 RepID=UPI00280CA99D|nr:S-layer homology domain-containing protein [Paenibacillus sp. LHD-38]MDQ8734728.1 S-layer homology domain-containing protein [Paenibacillus sp. LHD-38]
MQTRSVSYRSLMLFMGVIVFLSFICSAVLLPEQAKAADQLNVSTEIKQAAEQILNSGVISDWEALGLARSGKSLPASYLNLLSDELKEKKGEFRKVTDAERIAIAVRAAGVNAASFAGFNLIESIYNHAKMTNQGTNGPIFALIALDSGSYEVPANALWTREKLVDWLLSQQNAGGAFPLSEQGEDNLDITAMAISALAPYQEQANVKSAIDKAVSWLSSQQQVNGGFQAFGEDNSESVAQVIIALSGAGINPLDTRFLKKNGNLLTSLLRFRQADGGFSHAIDQPSNEMATEQALMALVAYDRFTRLGPALFDISADTSLTGVKEQFVDNELISSWAYDAVYRVFEVKIMVGVSGSELRFDPKKPMTRAEFATLLINLLGEAPAKDAAAAFKDIRPGAWYYGSIMRAKELGIIQGITADTFKPGQVVTRQETAIMIAKAFELKGNSDPLPFDDANSIHVSAKAYVSAVYANGLMQGSNGSFNPKAAVTREMAAVIAAKLLQKKNDTI